MPIEVPEGGTSGLLVELPPACNIQVEFIDGATGESVLSKSVYINGGVSWGDLFKNASLASGPDPHGIWTAICPLGHAEVMAYFTSGGLRTFPIEVRASGELHRIDIGVRASLKLTFERDGEPVAPPPDLAPQFFFEGGEYRFTWMSDAGTEQTFGLEPDKLYEVRIPKPNGFEAIESFTIDTAAQPVHERTIQLVPLR